MTIHNAWKRLDYEALPSTNTEAARLAREGLVWADDSRQRPVHVSDPAFTDRAPERFCVSATRQTAGRGRRGRAWEGGVGNVTASFVCRPKARLDAVGQLSLVAAVAAVEAVVTLCPELVPRAKWPNDILVGERKLAGILSEAEPDGQGGIAWAVIGIGVNVAGHPDVPEAPFPPVSLSALGCDATAETVLDALAASLAQWLDVWEADGFAPVRAAWQAVAFGQGRPVQVTLANDTRRGMFGGLDPHGNLTVIGEDGATHAISAGDVAFL